MLDFESLQENFYEHFSDDRVDEIDQGIAGVGNVVRMMLPDFETDQTSRPIEVETIGMSALEAASQAEATTASVPTVETTPPVANLDAYREQREAQRQSAPPAEPTNPQTSQPDSAKVVNLKAFEEQKRQLDQSRRDAAIESAQTPLIELEDLNLAL